MDQRRTTLERAFELARFGLYATVTDVCTKLKSERYDLRQVEGTALRKQLNQIIQTAKMNAHRI